MCVSILDNKAPIQSMVSGRDFNQGSTVSQRLEIQQVKELVTELRFIPMLKKALAVLKFIDTPIVKYQSD